MDAVSTIVARLIAQRGRGTTTDLAAVLGVSAPTVSRWAKGQTRVAPDYWPAIEAFFNLEAGTLGVEGARLGGRLDMLEAEVATLRSELDYQRRALDTLLGRLTDGRVDS